MTMLDPATTTWNEAPEEPALDGAHDPAGEQVGLAAAPDYALVQQVRSTVASGLRDARRERAEAGKPELGTDDERQLARSLIAAAVNAHRRAQLVTANTALPPTE